MSRETLADCKAYATSPRRGDHRLTAQDLTFKVLDIYGVRLYGIFVPATKIFGIIGFWQHPGIGISTRLADFLLPHVDTLQELLPIDPERVGDDDDYDHYIPKPTYLLDSPVHGQLRERIVSLLKRAPAPAPPATSISAPPPLSAGDPLPPKLTPGDVYLFPSGMAAIYRLQSYLSAANNNEYKSVAFGCLYHSTLDILEEFGGYELFGRGDESDLARLEKFLEEEESRNERKVQALYVEFPSNPVLVCSPLARLRALADKYEFVLVVDDTVGSFCNVDLLSVADVVVSSLTKSFSGYADVMAGSLVLNPLGPAYRKLRPLLRNSFHNELFVEDALVLERNSRDYLARSAILNRNAEAVVTFLQSKAENDTSAVSKVLYPTVSPTARDNYTPFMRAATPEFTPGYGCLFSVEFEQQEDMIAFYEALQVHMGPHLGAHLTLALPYNEVMFGRTGSDEKKARAESFGWSMLQIRVSVGLEDVDQLVETFAEAVRVADEVKSRRTDVVDGLDKIRIE